jgi:hypothetical protein
MRSLLSLLLAFVVATSALFLSGGGVAYAAFHCIRIHAVMGGFNGDNNIQYVELRMDAAGQTVLHTHQIEFFNAGGTLKATFTFPPGTFPFDVSVANGAVGDSVLIATQEFYDNVGVAPGPSDFTFTTSNTTAATPSLQKHPVQVPGGSVVWAGPPNPFFCAVGGMVPVDSVSYGGGSGAFPPAAPALPTLGTNQVLRLSNLNTKPLNNLAEYGMTLSTVSAIALDASAHLVTNPLDPLSLATPRNNSRTVLKLTVPAVGGVAEEPNLAAVPDKAQQSAGDSPSWPGYTIAGVAAAAMACGAGWYMYRRRIA